MKLRPNTSRISILLLIVTFALAACDDKSFYHFESGHVRPLAMSPDGTKLFAVNTPDNRLEIFNITPSGLVFNSTVGVGMEPVAVAARNNNEVWVINHLSDSASIVDVSVTPPRVKRTLLLGDEPRDIVFAGTGGNRAFITTAHRGQNHPEFTIAQLRTAGLGRADVWVFDANALGTSLGGTPLDVITLFGDTTRPLAVSPDKNTVYAGVFASGNQTTTVIEGLVCDGGSTAGPCTVSGVSVPGGLPAPNQNHAGEPGPETGLIVKFNRTNSRWEDELGRNWTNAVKFSLPDRDVFAINANTLLETRNYTGVGTILFNMITNPVNGKVYVTNTDAKNQVRFEGFGTLSSTVRGHLHEARITVLDGNNVLPRHLNKHINYSDIPQPAGVKDRSLATPLEMAISSDGSTLYVAAFGSSKVGVFSTAEIENNTFTPNASTHINVTGGGPSGLILDEPHSKLYVMTRFNNSIATVDTTTKAQLNTVALHNPEPDVVLDGRKFLYDARFTSSNGEASCSSCHVFGDMDHLAWDLGDPEGDVVDNPNPFPVIGLLSPFHPMKGPMTTQTLRGMANHGPMHWRGDRTGGNTPENPDPLNEFNAFTEFNGAFASLIGRDEGALTSGEMSNFTRFALKTTLPPNPIRNLDNSLTTAQQTGKTFYFNQTSDFVATCNGCHEVDASKGFFGGNGGSSFENLTQEFKVPHLRNLYQKIGMFGLASNSFITPGDNGNKGNQIRGFGFLHDGSVDTLFRFVRSTVFSFPGGDTQRRNVEEFLFAFDTTLAPIVGQQITYTGPSDILASARIDLFISRAITLFTLIGFENVTECDLIAKGTLNGVQRGWKLDSQILSFRSDRSGEPVLSKTQLLDLFNGTGETITFTCAPPGSGIRMGIDRDGDTIFDADDNCPLVGNASQLDADNDGIGDSCDL